MYNNLKYFLKTYLKFLIIPIIISLFLIIIGSVRTNKALILKGDTKEFSSTVKINSDYEIKGSFSTIYVSTMEKSTILQNFIVSSMNNVESYDMTEYNEEHLSDIESYKAGKIQYESSITNSLVLAYSEAKKEDNSINLLYSFEGFEVTYYGPTSSFRIGDMIKAINSKANDNIVVDNTNELALRRVINLKRSIGDIYTVIRNDKELDITLTKDDTFSAYSIYDIDYDNSYPSIKVKSNTIGGPSGGLLQTLSIYNELVKEDITHGLRIAGTGTIAYTGRVGAIGGIKEKIPTAYDDNIDVFLCVADNYDEALEAYNRLPNKNKMKLVKIETFYDALEYLKEGYKNDFKDL